MKLQAINNQPSFKAQLSIKDRGDMLSLKQKGELSQLADKIGTKDEIILVGINKKTSKTEDVYDYGGFYPETRNTYKMEVLTNIFESKFSDAGFIKKDLNGLGVDKEPTHPFVVLKEYLTELLEK